MLVGTAMTGTDTRPATTLGKRAFHPGDDDDDARRGEPVALAEQPMESGDADVVDAFDGVAHELGRKRRFFGDRLIGCAGRRDDNRALAGRRRRSGGR